MQIHLSVVYRDEMLAALRAAFGSLTEQEVTEEKSALFARMAINGFADRETIRPYLQEDQENFTIVKTAWVQIVEKKKGQWAPRAKTQYFFGTSAETHPFQFYCMDWVTENQRCHDASLFEALWTCEPRKLQIFVRNKPRHTTIQSLFEKEGPGVFRAFSGANYDEDRVSGATVVERMKERIFCAQALVHQVYDTCKSHMHSSIAEKHARRVILDSRCAYAFQWWHDGHGGPFEPILGCNKQ